MHDILGKNLILALFYTCKADHDIHKKSDNFGNCFLSNIHLIAIMLS